MQSRNTGATESGGVKVAEACPADARGDVEMEWGCMTHVRLMEWEYMKSAHERAME